MLITILLFLFILLGIVGYFVFNRLQKKLNLDYAKTKEGGAYRVDPPSKAPLVFKWGCLGLSLVLVLILIGQTITITANGTVRLVTLFGVVEETALQPGLSLINPFAKTVEIDVKTSDAKESMKVPTKKGLSVDIELSCLYKVDPSKAVELYRTVGTQYTEVLLLPNFRSITRSIIANYEAAALYGNLRDTIATEILNKLISTPQVKGLIIENILLRHLGLPKSVVEAVEAKVTAEQEAQKMVFILQREKQEAERKAIEAKGIADFQNIVTQGISEPLLRWKGIEATERLAHSPNSKVVVIGAGKDGMPLILGSDK